MDEKAYSFNEMLTFAETLLTEFASKSTLLTTINTISGYDLKKIKKIINDHEIEYAEYMQSRKTDKYRNFMMLKLQAEEVIEKAQKAREERQAQKAREEQVAKVIHINIILAELENLREQQNTLGKTIEEIKRHAYETLYC